MQSIQVIIPHLKNESLLRTCIDSLRDQSYPLDHIVVIDNGSTDHSCDFLLQDPYRALVTVMRIEKNTGFAYAVNEGILQGIKNECEYVFVLNDDTRLDPLCIENLINTIKTNDRIASVQPKILNAYHPDLIDSMGIAITYDMSALNVFQSVAAQTISNHDQEVFGTTGCASLYRVSALRHVAYHDHMFFDNDYFAYYEDVDMAYRLRFAGYCSYVVPSAKMEHIHSATEGSYSAFKSFHIHRNHLYTIAKYAQGFHLISFLFRIPFRYALLLSSVFKKKGPSHRLRNNIGMMATIQIVGKSWIDFVRSLPRLIKQRRQIHNFKQVTQSEIAVWYNQFSVPLEKTIYEERV